jgi:uncharacterized protein
MPVVDKHDPGRFCWIELAAGDHAGAVDFYTRLFGWEVEHREVPGGGTYSMFARSGRNVAACFRQVEDERNAGVPPHWNSYVSVIDVDATVGRADQLGGKVIAPPFDVMDVGRMAVMADPTGALLYLWQPKLHQGAGLVNEDGSLGWNELWTSDVAAAGDFYSALFGCKADVTEMATGTYTVFRLEDGTAVGGMTTSGAGIPSNWLVYFEAEDAKGTIDRATELGAKILFGPESMEGVGTFGTLSDPHNAVFAVIESD